MPKILNILTIASAGFLVVPACALTEVVSYFPPDGASNISAPSTIQINFSTAMDVFSLRSQITAGPCTETIQVSSDDFASCIAMASFFADLGDELGTLRVATLTPAPALAFGSNYRVRVLATASSTLGVMMAADDLQPNGFTTTTQASCPSGVTISQVYGGGGNLGSQFTNDFIELHNPTIQPISIGNYSVQVGVTTTWTSRIIPANTNIAPGGYFLIEGYANGGGTIPLQADFVTSPPLAINSGSHKVALIPNSITLPTISCPAGATDFVGFGPVADCFEGSAAAPQASATLAVQRKLQGNMDTNDNAMDFVTATPAPRNAGTAAPQVCSAAANETAAAREFAFCNVQFPSAFNVAPGATTPAIYARVFQPGLTESAGPSPQIIAQIGYGLATLNPQNEPGFTWLPATYNAQVGNDDEYTASFVAPAAGNYSYASRFSMDGTNWTYCDTDGAGSNGGLAFSPAKLGAMTVVAPGAVSLVNVTSRKTHGSAGPFNVVIDKQQVLSGNVTVEPRAIGAGHTIYFQFSGPVVIPGTVFATAGAAFPAASGNDVVVTLIGIPDGQRVGFNLTGVNNTSSGSASMGFLLGDVDNSRTISPGDLSSLKARSGQQTDVNNFRFDINATGTINASDISALKVRPGRQLSP